MHLPTIARPIASDPDAPLRLAILGAPFKGKTSSALTAPNPIVLDFDNNLKEHQGREDLLRIPFWREDTWTTLMEEYGKDFVNEKKKPNKPAIFRWWLLENIDKFEPGQTLILDGWTSYQDMRDAYYKEFPVKGKNDKDVGFIFWGMKLDQATELMLILKRARCHVIVCIHEMRETDPDTGIVSNKKVPLMQGRFADKMLTHFTDAVRCVVKNTSKEVKNPVYEYFWQTEADDIDLTIRKKGKPTFIKPDFMELLRLYDGGGK